MLFCVLVLLLSLSQSANASTQVRGSRATNLIRQMFKPAVTTLVSTGLLFNQQVPVRADDDAWTDRNRLAAEVWRKVDESFYDRSFGGHDWFSLRQQMVKRSYGSDEEVYKQIQDSLQQVGDKYTRYLPPAQYSVLMNSAMGELCGIGAELELTPDGRVKIINLQPDSPAAASGLQVGDIILNVDGSDTTGLSPEEVAALLRYFLLVSYIL